MNELSLELESEGSIAAAVLVSLPSIEAVVAAVREHLRVDHNLHLFEKDKDEELHSVAGRRAIGIVAHRHRSIFVTVQFNGESKTETVSPSATVSKVLHWATGKRAFNLDDDARPKANLILRGAEHPLPKDAAIGRFTIDGSCNVEVDLTLKDFTNG